MTQVIAKAIGRAEEGQEDGGMFFLGGLFALLNLEYLEK